MPEGHRSQFRKLVARFLLVAAIGLLPWYIVLLAPIGLDVLGPEPVIAYFVWFFGMGLFFPYTLWVLGLGPLLARTIVLAHLVFICTASVFLTRNRSVTALILVFLGMALAASILAHCAMQSTGVPLSKMP